MMCARALIKQGFHVHVFDEMKDKGPGSNRSIEEVIEYIPIMCENYREHPVWKLINEGKSHYGSLAMEIDVCDGEQKFYAEEVLEQAERKFFEIIAEILGSGGGFYWGSW